MLARGYSPGRVPHARARANPGASGRNGTGGLALPAQPAPHIAPTTSRKTAGKTGGARWKPRGGGSTAGAGLQGGGTRRPGPRTCGAHVAFSLGPRSVSTAGASERG